MTLPTSLAGALRIAVASVAWAAALPGFACSPPPLVEESGFIRSHVDRLPRNAKGVVFLAPSGTARASDFRLTSSGDGRALALRVRPIKDTPWVRLEPVGGFRPGASYLFRYLPAHRAWRHADTQTVTIDDLLVDTAGRYAIELAPQTVHRVVTVPTGTGPCTKPTPAVAQAFSHVIPPGLRRYQSALHYDVDQPAVASPTIARTDPWVDEWGPGSRPAVLGWLSFGPSSPPGQRDKVIAPCGNRWHRVRMRSFVAFPEVDERRYLTDEVSMDLSRGAGGECGELEALLRTIEAKPGDATLREACRLFFGFVSAAGKARPADIPIEEWERSLAYPVVDMTPTCELVSLAHLWRDAKRRPDPAFVNRIGAALERGFAISGPAKRDLTIQALAYLLTQLPERFRQGMAPRLVKPMLPQLVEELAGPHPRQPEALAQLIMGSGALTLSLRAQLAIVAGGTSAAAPHARTILAASPH